MNAADEAQVLEDMDRGAGLLRVQQQIAASQLLETADNCAECGGMIPSARQAANPGCQTCVPCGETLERSARRARGVVLVI